jgi:uncharacterized SAM-dependent methyltransferase
VTIAGQAFDFAEGDNVHTENSYKYTVESFQRLVRSAGWEPASVWADASHNFAVFWLLARTC